MTEDGEDGASTPQQGPPSIKRPTIVVPTMGIVLRARSLWAVSDRDLLRAMRAIATASRSVCPVFAVETDRWEILPIAGPESNPEPEEAPDDGA